MLFDRGLNDNLTLRRQKGGRWPWLTILLILLIAALAAAAGRYAWKRWQSRQVAEPSSSLERLERGQEQQTLTQIRALMADQAWLAAREQCYLALERHQDSPKMLNELERWLGQINLKLLLTPMAMPEKEEYLVQSGDSLERIAKKFSSTIELIQQSNNLKGHMLHPGDRLLIFKATLTLTVSKSRNDLLLKANDRFFKRYQVGTGQYGKTPVGTFVISDKIAEPPWWRPDGKMIPYGDKENVLGTRWMSITPIKDTAPVSGYGIHGTWEPDTVGQQASAGCVRMLNSDVEELFMLTPIGAEVFIVE